MKPAGWEDEASVVAEVTDRVLRAACPDEKAAERVLFETIYDEKQRIEEDGGSDQEAAFYDALYTRAVRATPREYKSLVRILVEHFADEVSGRFDPKVYGLATRVVPKALDGLLNTLSPLRLWEALSAWARGRKPESLTEQVVVDGETDALRRVARLGTVVLVPTHSSNLDSVLVGFALHNLGLPPFTYGAGLNLFANPVVGFFIGRLGAYSVDRRKKARLYKDVLKTYAQCTMEAGRHNLFFPGGTRSRSGSVERRLKKGLLGAGLAAYVENLLRGNPRPDVFVVPLTINYQLVLEAETLVEDHLKAVGKSRYIIDDDESTQVRRILEFVQRLFSLHSRIHLRFGRPMDVLGNPVDEAGISLDPRERAVDRRKYFMMRGEVVRDAQRDREYVHELAEAVVQAYHRDTVLKSTNIVAHAAFLAFAEQHPGMDLYHLLRAATTKPVPLRRLHAHLARDLEALRERGVHVDWPRSARDQVALVADALAHLGTYHSRRALVRRGDQVWTEDARLLLYYGNRLAGFGVPHLERLAHPDRDQVRPSPPTGQGVHPEELQTQGVSP